MLGGVRFFTKVPEAEGDGDGLVDGKRGGGEGEELGLAGVDDVPAIEMAETADLLAVDVDVVGVVDELRDEEREGVGAGRRLESESIPGVAGVGGEVVALAAGELGGQGRLEGREVGV